MSFIDTLWYGKGLSAALLRVPLLPFSALFGLVTSVRRSLYTQGYFKSTGPVVPVVVVGGVTVGGTGKTPIVIALVNELTERGFNPGVLSRGYKAKCDVFPSQVPMDCDPEIFGDEPSLIRRSTGVPVVIDPVRTRGADYLAGLGVDVIITDDGLQHYALDREVEICVLDGTRMLGNGCLLPAGPLREGEWRLSAVNSIVVSGAVAHLGHNPMMLRPSAITALNPDNPKQLEERGEVTAFCGIGNPSRFYKTLEDCGFVVVKKVEVGDHNKMPFDKLRELASERTVIMTAKDAIKYRKEAKENAIENVFVLNVAAQLSKHFFDDIVSKIKLSLHRVEQRRRRREEAGYVLQKVEGIEDYGIKADADYITKTAARLSAEMQNAELAKARLKAALRADKEGPVLPADDIEINPELNIDFSKHVSKDDDPPRQMEFEHQARADFVKRETVVVDAYRPGIGKSSSSKLDSKRDDDLDDQLNTKHDDQLQENAVASKHDDNANVAKHTDNAVDSKQDERVEATKHTDNVIATKQDEGVDAAKHDDKIEENVVDTKSDANHADDQVDAINADDAIESHQITDETDEAKSDTCEDNAKPSAVVESVEPKQDMYGPAAALMEKAAKFYEHAETLRNIAEQAQAQEAATDTHKSEDQSVELTEAKADELSAVATAAEQNANSTNAAQEEQPQATAQDLIEESATANEDAAYIASLWVPYIPKAISNYSAAAVVTTVENEATEKTVAKQETVEAKSEPEVDTDKSKITATADQAKSDSVASDETTEVKSTATAETAEVKVDPVVYDLWIPSIPSLFMLQESRATVVLESKQEAQDLKQIEAVAVESKSAKDQDDAISKSVATDPALQDQAIDASLAKDAVAQDKSAQDSGSKDAEAKSESETDVQVAKEYKLWIPSIPVLPSYNATAALEASQTAATTTTTTKSKSTAKKATTKASATDTASKATTAKASASGSAVKTSPGEAIAAAKGTTKKTATKSAASDGSVVSKTTTRRAPTRAVIASIDELPKSIRKKTTKATKDAAKSEAVLPLIDALDKSESIDAANTLVAAAKKDDAISAVETTKSTTRTRKKASESKATDKSETTEAEASTATRKSTAKKTTTKSTSTSAAKSTTTRKRTSTAAKSKAAEDATELSEDKVEVATSSKTTTKAKSTAAKATKKTSKAESASDAEVTTKKSAKASTAAEGAADSEASTKKTTKASAKADAAKAESAKADSDKAESASESESSAKSTAKRTVKRTTRSSAKDEKDIFALKKMRDVYDPNAVPTKLKRKTTTKSKSAE
ncbi:MAG: tetraacyldisaccharide 4'-kinase [Anaerobiospirillum succiniciproducens]|uniref:tetraacyldisaccharide 4'-kinase n=1 Tax=Anaerobiospirillum succiniciproducens TaxID=13335 RepID=UPI0026DBBCC0|nr:tetraacyldisaccharide 4'-kinase [Anaerobiospirillum succiniciproducens]MDO4675761.1 tetraacyldisaccharide 4'-kinase [Anaerobiospirillum succiniciproducens]